jgi:hypothetical protein
MNVPYRKVLPAVAFAVVGALAVPASAAPVDCARPSGLEQVRACAAAANGVQELRQFIQRTRGIYILYIKDFDGTVKSTAAAPDKDDAPKVALRKEK